MATPQKVSVYSVNDLKNATDDAIAPYLTSLPKPYTFSQQHSHTNIRLLVGYTAVSIAGALFYADWKLGWDATKAYTAPACICYFILNGFLTYWIWAVEKGTVFVGVREGGQKLSLRSSSKKYSPLYTLKVIYEPPSSAKGDSSIKWEDKEITGSFTSWFSKEGYLQQKELKKWLARNIEVVSMADPQSKQVGEDKYQEILDDVVMLSAGSETVPGSSAGTQQTPGTKAKKNKKKT